jgi:hypothetical protein
MREIHPRIKEILESDILELCYLVRITSRVSTIQHTTNSVDITIPGWGTFIADNSLTAVDAPKLSDSIDRESYKLTYKDVNTELRILFEDNLYGAKVNTWLCIKNSTESYIEGFAPGQYFTDPDMITLAYSGVVDMPGYALDPDNGTIVAVIECSSPMAALNLTRPFYTSGFEMRRRAPNDSSFDNVAVSAAKQVFKWGKDV